MDRQDKNTSPLQSTPNQSLIKVSHESHLDENPDLCSHDLIISSSDFLTEKYNYYSKSREIALSFLPKNQKSSGAGFPI